MWVGGGRFALLAAIYEAFRGVGNRSNRLSD